MNVPFSLHTQHQTLPPFLPHPPPCPCALSQVNQVMSGRVHLEFEAQAKLETELGLPVTMPIDSSDPQMCARLEISFLVSVELQSSRWL